MKRLKCLPLICLLLSSWTLADSGVWRVEKGSERILIAGTIHMLRPADMPLPPEYRQALESAERVAFETDPRQVARPEFAMEMNRRFALPEGESLRARLSPQSWQRLERYAQANQVPLAHLERFTPGYASVMLSSLQMLREGRTLFLDLALAEQARAAGKTIAALETPGDQLRAIDAFAGVEPDVLLADTLDAIEEQPPLADQMQDALLAGDLETLGEWASEMQALMPAAYDGMLVERNRNWLPQIRRMAGEPQRTLVLVGALHLAGEHGLLHELERAGYRIEHYRPQP
ncbi:MAG TPA: TraB/GumN family protein [Pseudomonas sp.]|nr:TraB/GumN family protein [Pseudomonas sp.]